MPGAKGKGQDRRERRPDTGRGLFREVTYLHSDEEEGLVRYAKRERCSKAEVLRRAIRKLLEIED